MRQIHKLTTIGALMVAVSVPAMAQRVEPGAFVRKPAPTIQALIHQVETDPVVADRFTRHFHMTKAEVIEYLRSLHLAKLKKSGSYRIFNVHADGVVRARVFELKEGTLIFADANGKPILKKNCANPLTMGELSVVRDERTEPAADVIPMADIEPPEALVAAEVVQPPFTPMGMEVTPPQPFAPLEARSMVGGAAGFTFIPLLFIFNKTSKVECPCPPIPEPATLTAFAIAPGVAYILRRRRRKAV